MKVGDTIWVPMVVIRVDRDHKASLGVPDWLDVGTEGVGVVGIYESDFPEALAAQPPKPKPDERAWYNA